MKPTYRVLEPLDLVYGSDVHRPSGTHLKTIQVGQTLYLESQAPNGNVWFITEENERAKVECGEVANLVKRGILCRAGWGVPQS